MVLRSIFLDTLKKIIFEFSSSYICILFYFLTYIYNFWFRQTKSKSHNTCSKLVFCYLYSVLPVHFFIIFQNNLNNKIMALVQYCTFWQVVLWYTRCSLNNVHIEVISHLLLWLLYLTAVLGAILYWSWSPYQFAWESFFVNHWER